MLQLIIENPERIRICDPERKKSLKTLVLQPLVILLFFGSIFYFFGIIHPSYTISCEEKKDSFATGCSLKSTYYLIFPWYTHLGNLKQANFQINPSVRMNKKRNSCGEIALLTTTASGAWSYTAEKQQQTTFYLNCGDFDELRQIANEINIYLTQKDIKVLNVPSLPTSWMQYLLVIGIIAALLYNSKKITTIFDKNTELVTVKITWVISWTKTYPLKDVKRVTLFQPKENSQHLILNLLFSRIDLGDISELSIPERKQLCRSINDFLKQ